MRRKRDKTINQEKRNIFIGLLLVFVFACTAVVLGYAVVALGII